MRKAVVIAVVVVAIVVAALARQRHSARDYTRKEAIRLTGGNPERGQDLISYYGCTSCHTVPGVTGPQSTVGPPLERLRQRSFLAGEVPNTAANLERWIRQPHSVEPKTAMPEMGVSEQDAKDLAAYLYTLR